MPAVPRKRAIRRARVSSEGRVTLPKPVREALGIRAGSAVAFEIAGSGEVVLRRHAEPEAPLRGALRAFASDPVPSTEDIDAGIAQAVGDLDAASRSARG